MFIAKYLISIAFFHVIQLSSSSLISLTNENFEEEINDHAIAMIYFNVPWDESPVDIEIELQKVTEYAIRHSFNVTFFKVNCVDDDRDICAMNNVEGQSALKLFRDGYQDDDYKGSKDAASIINYLKMQMGESAVELHDQEEVKSFLSANTGGTVIGYFDKESQGLENFTAVAAQLRKTYRFAYIYMEEPSTGAVEERILLYRPLHLQNIFDSGNVTFAGEASVENLINFIKINYHGLVGHRTSDNVEDFSYPLLIAYFHVDYVKNPKGTNYWRNRILKVASSFKGIFNFAFSSRTDFEEEINHLGLDDDMKLREMLIVAIKSDAAKFIMRDSFSVESLEKFVNDVMDNRIEPYFRSEALPTENDGNVKIAVANNFDEIVTNSGKDAFIEFYAPWCTHCMSVAPAFAKLGEELSDEEVDIVKMDATVNDVLPPYNIDGYPSFYWSPKNSKEKPEPYNGGRELEDFLSFIAKEATYELKGFDRQGTKKSVKTEL